MKFEALKELLEEKYHSYNQSSFIEDDPVQIPHSFKGKENIEIMGFWVAILAWGNRKTIINKAKELIERMDGNPFDFIKNHQEKDLKQLEGFKHRTFNEIDAQYFVDYFQRYYQKHSSLEEAFQVNSSDSNIEKGLIGFREQFFDVDYAPKRTGKHIASPARKSACKRINMFLRWMVRKDQHGVDLGIWTNIKTSQLICPLDVHVDRVARKLGLIERKNTDWKTAVELTENLKKFDSNDPVKYDFSLFGMGVNEKGGVY